jgi:trans-2-enoyl-CoA reductase
MKEEGIHEGCIDKFNVCIKSDCILEVKSQLDEKGRIADDLEMRPDVQEK